MGAVINSLLFSYLILPLALLLFAELASLKESCSDCFVNMINNRINCENVITFPFVISTYSPSYYRVNNFKICLNNSWFVGVYLNPYRDSCNSCHRIFVTLIRLSDKVRNRFCSVTLL